MKKITFAFFVLISILYSNSYSQDLFNSNNLGTVNVDKLTDSQIDQVKSQLSTKGMNIDQIKPLVISKGMSEIEFDKLKNRINSKKEEEVNNLSSTIQPEKKEVISINQETSPTNPLIFGSELFNNPNLNFEPNLHLATPVNYILGPGDKIQISVFGIQEFNTEIEISSEGSISIQHIGFIYVAGLSIEAATQKIKKSIAKVYSTVASGQSQVSVNLIQIRTIKITVIGGQQPGNYSISSLASVFNALHLAGGPGNNGSYRKIELIRNNKVFKIVDLYRYLLTGDQSDNIGLKENDLIRIPSNTNQITIEGEVKRPGIYELIEGETFDNLLIFASGFKNTAYTSSVSILQKTMKAHKVYDLNIKDYKSYTPKNSEVIRVSKILDLYENRIRIDGAVYRPSIYSLTDNMRVLDLINKAEGLKDDAYKSRAKLIRVKPDLTSEMIQIDLLKVLNGDTSANVKLNKEDILTIYSVLDFQEKQKISIYGEVKNAGQYNYLPHITLNDLIIMAGGLNDAASKKIEIARMIKSEEIDKKNPSRVQLFNLEINPENNEQSNTFELSPFDVVNIRTVSVYEKPQLIQIHGAVNYPGSYALANKKDRISDLIERAGGLSELANIEGVKVKRPIPIEQIKELEIASINVSDSIDTMLSKKLIETLKYTIIPVNWKKIARNHKNSTNILLQEGDEIIIAKQNECIKVSGEVLLNSEIPYKRNKNFKYYVNSVGGVNSNGTLRKSYIIYPNGKADIVKRRLFFNHFPEIKPGSQIVIVKKVEKQKKSNFTELLGALSVFTSLSGIIITIMKITQ